MAHLYIRIGGLSLFTNLLQERGEVMNEKENKSI